MIRIVQGHDRKDNRVALDQMYRLRAKVFADRLGWQVEVVDGREIDQFDRLNPVYLLAIDDDGGVIGCARLLPTTGPTMLGQVFDRLLGADQVIRSPIVWESTRFCVDTSRLAERGPRSLARTTAQLMAAEIEIGLSAGLRHIVTVVDLRMERILIRGGCPIERIGDVVQYGDIPTLAVLVPVNSETLSRICATNGIDGSCLEHGTFRLGDAA